MRCNAPPPNALGSSLVKKLPASLILACWLTNRFLLFDVLPSNASGSSFFKKLRLFASLVFATQTLSAGGGPIGAIACHFFSQKREVGFLQLFGSAAWAWETEHREMQ